MIFLKKFKPYCCRQQAFIIYLYFIQIYLNYRFRTLSKSCGDCLTNTTDCYKDDCISGDGYSKYIITINEQLPGPSISVR